MVRVLAVAEEETETTLISEDDMAILDNFIARQRERISPKALKQTRKQAGAG
jgi:hypothetical protein